MHRSLTLAVVCAVVFAGAPAVAHAQNRGFIGGLGGITSEPKPARCSRHRGESGLPGSS